MTTSETETTGLKNHGWLAALSLMAVACSDDGADDRTADVEVVDTVTGDATEGDGDAIDGGDAASDGGGDTADDTGDALPPRVDQAGLCQVGTSPRLTVNPGSDLLKVTLQDPLAVCNDGTPAVIYVRPAPAGSADADKWVVWLEGGGGCQSGKDCGDRWCGRHPIYSAAKMSSRYAPDGIRGIGIFDAEPAQGAIRNNFAGFNHVVSYYCSSDGWVGSREATWRDDSGTYPDFSTTLHGHYIVSGIFAALRAGAVSDDGAFSLPSIDEASVVLFMGTSAGGGGVRQNADRVAALLRAGNPDVDYRVVVDAGIHNVEADPPHVSEADAEAIKDQFWALAAEQRGGRLDASCLEFHADDPRPCALNVHVLLHHVTTPYFVKMDISDAAASPGAYPDGQTFARATFELLQSLATVDTWSEENMSYTPGVFAPSCGHHVNLESADFYRIQITRGSASLSHHDVLWNWFEGTTPDVVIHQPSEGIDSVCP